jgi:sphingolipid delta-4 desaturase
MTRLEIIHDQTHRERRKAILARYPGVRALFGKDPTSLFWAAALSVAQLCIGWGVSGLDWWAPVLAALTVGAFVGHAQNVLIHEATHDLILRGSAANKLAGIVANIATVFPSAIAFRHYHMLHHRFLGERGGDADLPTNWELRVFDGSRLGKFVWLLLLPLWYGLVHPVQARPRIPLDRWLALNWLVTGGVFLAAWYWGGDMMALYLFLSAWFAVGMHPAGAHILQEHIWFSGPRETTSYYGPINRASFNFGHHVEHHDFITIPGRNLPKLRAMAPEFFPDDPNYRSRARLLWRFVMDPNVRIGGRYIR